MTISNQRLFFWTVIGWLISLLILWYCLISPPVGKWFSVDVDDLGNAFGIINSFVGAITLWLVYRTFSLQESAFEVQKKELEKTREMLKEQTELVSDQRFQDKLSFALQITQSHLDRMSIPQGIYGSDGNQKSPVSHRKKYQTGENDVPNYVLYVRDSKQSEISLPPMGEKFVLVEDLKEGLSAIEFLSQLDEEYLRYFVNGGFTSHFKKYLHTLEFVENLVKNRTEEKSLVTAQINESEKRLFRKLKMTKTDIPMHLELLDRDY